MERQRKVKVGVIGISGEENKTNGTEKDSKV